MEQEEAPLGQVMDAVMLKAQAFQEPLAAASRAIRAAALSGAAPNGQAGVRCACLANAGETARRRDGEARGRRHRHAAQPSAVRQQQQHRAHRHCADPAHIRPRRANVAVPSGS